MHPSIVDSVLWRREDAPGHDACVLSRARHGFSISGVAVFLHGGKACKLEYEVACDTDWMTTSAKVTGSIGRVPVHAEIRRSKGGWRHDGASRDDLGHCQDIDLAFTPATNVLPIRRLKLRPGRQAATSAAWLRFPSLALAQLDQVYENLGKRVYRYTALSGRFQRRLRVRPSGLVDDYPGLWSLERAT